MQKKTVAFSRDASNLFFHILTQCNLSCSHCYINRSQHGKKRLDIETIREWLRLFASKNQNTNVIFLGGEPTLHPDLSLAVKEARRLRFNSVTIDTNGFLFHDILDKINPEELDFLSFSLDGATKETNDRIRGKGSFDAVMTGIEKAVKKNFSCSMIYTVSEKNIHELRHMVGLVKDLGLERFFIQVIGLRGESGNDKTPGQVTKETWLDIIPKVAETIAGYGVRVTYPKVFLEPGEEFLCAGNVAKNYFVFPNGRVYQCPICEDHPLHSYTIVDNRLEPNPPVTERELFNLTIPEGCVMNKLIQPGNLAYDSRGNPIHKIACCMLKEEVSP
ncbi:radical SAM protein [Desulfospira joergensenii]|uniref:radical SAM protein n=1 Tax=Desulfospira joergensenii TaxID=53329 RepID=UPI0003B48F1B|nr:radical SAM protein [Desulfospira joergensenii]